MPMRPIEPTVALAMEDLVSCPVLVSIPRAAPLARRATA